MIESRQMRIVMCLVVAAVAAMCYAQPAEAKKDSAAQKLIKSIQEEIKAYEQTLKAAQERMKAANEAGEEVQPLIEPAEKQMRQWKEEMEAQQRKRAEASREMQEQIKADPGIEQARLAVEKAEAKRDERADKLMPQIQAEETYQDLAGKCDAAEQYLAKIKQEKREEDIPYAATALAKAQGELGTYVQDELAAIPAYKALADEVDQAQSHRRATEREAAERYRGKVGLDQIDAMYEEKRDAYQESREKLRDLELKLKGLKSDYKDAEHEADWATQRIERHKRRIETLKR